MFLIHHQFPIYLNFKHVIFRVHPLNLWNAHEIGEVLCWMPRRGPVGLQGGWSHCSHARSRSMGPRRCHQHRALDVGAGLSMMEFYGELYTINTYWRTIKVLKLNTIAL